MRKNILSVAVVLMLTAIMLPVATMMIDNVYAGATLIWPVPDTAPYSGVTYNSNPPHIARDIASGKAGLNVVAALSGTVYKKYTCSHNTFGQDASKLTCCYGFGTGLVIKGSDGRYYQYAHMQYGSIPSTIKVGTYVNAGTVIGRVGSTGNASGPHLHFEIDTTALFKNPVDPHNEVYATGHTHSYGSKWTITQQATCTAAGSKYRSCSCGNRQTETIPALGHSFGPYILNKSATCTEAGSKTRICDRCGKKETANIAKLGHEFTNACDSSCNRKGCTYTRTTYHNFASTEWKYTDKLPAGISTADYEIQYNNTQTKEAASSPGTGWIKGAATTKYVNSGSPYDLLGIPLSTSDSRVLVKYSYYHYCGGSMGNYANFAMTGGFNHWDAITDPNSVTVVQTGTDGDDSRYTWYVLKWKSNGAYAYCNSSTTCDGKYGTHGNRSYAWYRVYTYQNKVKQTTYKWTKESGWTTKKDSSASAVKIRYRLRNYKLTAATPTANGKITTKCEICGEENATSTIPRIDAKSVALKSSNIVVKDVKGNALTINNDYTVMPTSDSGSFNINFCGNYSGTLLYTNKDVGAMKVKSLKLTAGKKKLTAKWDKTKKAFNSYQIRYSAKSNMSNAKTLVVNSTKATSKTISKLSAKKKYYVQIRRCKLINGYECYSPWSFKKSVKTK